MGRKRSANPMIFKTVGLSKDDWDFLDKWFDSDNPSLKVRELLERAKRFWPAGPNAFR